MDIREIRSRNTGPADQSQGPQGVAPSQASRGPTDHTPDRVTLSERAQAFQETRRAALAVPDVRTDRVDAVRRGLAEGSLVPDPERVARALLAQGIVRF